MAICCYKKIYGSVIKFELPKHSNGMSVLAPGWDEQITHSLFDQTGAGQFWGELYENIDIKIQTKLIDWLYQS